jgi:hypothetical protein
MENITNYIELKNAIALLEVEQAINSELLRTQFQITYEGLKPLNIIENTMKDIVTSPLIGKSILGTTLGLAVGFLTKKVAVGASGNIFRNLFGSFLQLGITNLISQHPEAIKNFGAYVFDTIRSKAEPVNDENVS